MSAAEDDITTGELSRNIKDMRETVDKRFDQLIATMAGFVTMQLFQAEMAASRDAQDRAEREITQALNGLRDDLDKEVQRIDDRIRDGNEKGWKAGLALFGGVIGPIIVMIIAAVILGRVVK